MNVLIKFIKETIEDICETCSINFVSGDKELSQYYKGMIFGLEKVLFFLGENKDDSIQ